MGRKMKDLTGMVFNNLTVIRFIGRTNNRYLWECRCACGSILNVDRNNFVSGHTKSCGCLLLIFMAKKFTTHGESDKTKEYRAWCSIKKRCFTKSIAAYSRYGGRGITMYAPWAESYTNFLQDVGRAPSRYHSIERVNNDGNYEPGNVCWATMKQQNNNRRSNHNITYNGQTKNIKTWCDQLGLNARKIRQRINRGWSPEKAFEII